MGPHLGTRRILLSCREVYPGFGFYRKLCKIGDDFLRDIKGAYVK